MVRAGAFDPAKYRNPAEFSRVFFGEAHSPHIRFTELAHRYFALVARPTFGKRFAAADVIASAHEKAFDQFGNAGFLLPSKLASEGKRFFAQMQVNPLNAHAHKLAIVGLCVKVIFVVYVGATKTRMV
jgi:hypothetical protein